MPSLLVAPNTCRSSEQLMLYATLLAPIILRWHLNFWKFRLPLVNHLKSDIFLNNTIASVWRHCIPVTDSSALMLFREIIAMLRIIREHLNVLWGKLQSLWLLNHVVCVVATVLLSNYVIVNSQKRKVRIFSNMFCFSSLSNTIFVAAVWMRWMKCLFTFSWKGNATDCNVGERVGLG